MPDYPQTPVTASDASACLRQAEHRYQIPEYLLWAIVRKEGGLPGSRSPNSNGTHDLGPAQVNTSWLPELAPFGISESALAWDYCLNVAIAAWILAKMGSSKGDWYHATMAYHIGPNKWSAPDRASRLARGRRYADSVFTHWEQYRASAQMGHLP